MASDSLSHWESDRHLDVVGVWIDLGEGVEWRVARAGGHNFAHAKALAEIKKPGPNASAWDEFSYTASCLAGVYVKDWRGMVDRDTGEALEFNPGLCFQELLGKPDLVSHLMEVILDRDRFRDPRRQGEGGDRGVSPLVEGDGGSRAASPNGRGDVRDVPVAAGDLSRFGVGDRGVSDGSVW
jgi:hypothetical protein